ncbi:CopG family transcriptional regulator [uncultured Oscillibacter sp.]|uniref:CopG family transcriptional regulator n=1 Tax=uncultured Oscillibacter sp. TaxID=876091 RepID=UPI0026007EEB|nr:CopG family transcriptional regulator [uncultured Oscillibacter sp.]
MSRPRGRPPIDDPKSVRFEIRMTEEQDKTLRECAERLQVTRTDVINKGIAMVKAALDEK